MNLRAQFAASKAIAGDFTAALARNQSQSEFAQIVHPSRLDSFPAEMKAAPKSPPSHNTVYGQ